MNNFNMYIVYYYKIYNAMNIKKGMIEMPKF